MSENVDKAEIDHCLVETHKHINLVRHYINGFIVDLMSRASNHDKSKLEDPELSVFAKHTSKLKDVSYGTDEYNKLLELVKPAIDHHFSKNRHHAEHWPEGIESMTLVDLIEMLSDWKAATQRNKNGNIEKSLDINSKKYNFSPQLKCIFENTIREYFRD